MSSIFEAYCTGKLARQLSIEVCVNHEAMNGCKNLKDCLENVDIQEGLDGGSGIHYSLKI